MGRDLAPSSSSVAELAPLFKQARSTMGLPKPCNLLNGSTGMTVYWNDSLLERCCMETMVLHRSEPIAIFFAQYAKLAPTHGDLSI